MRPRVFPAEDLDVKRQTPPKRMASMRPRVFPAEDAQHRCPHHSTLLGFNEAAGIPRGRLLLVGIAQPISPSGFNEAAGIPRGRHGGNDLEPALLPLLQ